MLKGIDCVMENFIELFFMVIKLFVKVEFEEDESECVPCEPCGDQLQVSQRKFCDNLSERIDLLDQSTYSLD